MKKHTIISAIATVGILLVGPAAFAQAVNVDTTGPGSPVDVTVTNDTTNNCNVNNNVNVNNNNTQTTGTGNATGSTNTTGGNVTTGDAGATNSNNTSVTANGCGTTVATTTPTPTPTPVVTPVVTPAVKGASTVKALPDTGVSPLAGLVGISALVATAAGIAKFGAGFLARR